MDVLKSITTSAITNITNFIAVLNEVDDIRIAVEGLIHGQLSPMILPPSILETTLTEIRQALSNSSTGLFLEPSPAHYYRASHFIVARQGNNLLLALRFPLSPIPVSYTLHEFQTFPVPVPGNDNVGLVTQIFNLPYGIAFHSTRPRHQYLLFHSKPELVGSEFLYAAHSSEPLRYFFRHNTCASALIQDDRQLVLKLCQFHLRPGSLIPSVIPLTYSTILVTNVSSLIYTCERRHVFVDGCIQCQLTIPCMCYLKTPFAYIPPRLTDCIPGYNNVTKFHTINLAALQSFANDVDLGSLLGSTLLDTPPPVNLPSFNIFQANVSSRLATDKQLSYDLHRAANITKQDEKVFHSLAETLWHDSHLLESVDLDTTAWYSPTWPSPWIFVSFLLTACALIGVFFLFYRLKVLTATIAAMHVTVHKVAALDPTLPAFLSFFTTTTLGPTNKTIELTTTSQPTPPNTSIWSDLILLVCIMTLLILLFKKIPKCSSNSNKSFLFLEFGQPHDSTHTVQVPCQTLPGKPSQYYFTASKFIENIDIEGTIRPILTVQWHTLRIHHNDLDVTFDFNGLIPLNLIQAYRLKNILDGTFWCSFIACYEGTYHPIPIYKEQEPTPEQSNSMATALIVTQDEQKLQTVAGPKFWMAQSNVV